MYKNSSRINFLIDVSESALVISKKTVLYKNENPGEYPGFAFHLAQDLRAGTIN